MRKWLVLLMRFGLGFVFVWAASTKLVDPGSLAKTMSAYKLLPVELLGPVAYFLPGLELLAGLGLIFGVWLRGATLWVNLMLLLFLAVLWYGQSLGLEVDCGCFGPATTGASAREAIIRDLIMLPIGLLLMWDSWFGRRRSR